MSFISRIDRDGCVKISDPPTVCYSQTRGSGPAGCPMKPGLCERYCAYAPSGPKHERSVQPAVPLGTGGKPLYENRHD